MWMDVVATVFGGGGDGADGSGLVFQAQQRIRLDIACFAYVFMSTMINGILM